jgi:MEMO1 family protein
VNAVRRATMLILIAGTATAAVLGASGNQPTRVGRARATHPSTFFDERAFARAMARSEAIPARRVDGARAVIVPHHWLAGDLIVTGLRDAAAGRRVRRVVLIGPNHIGAGGASVTTSERAWATPFGMVEADAAVGRLVRRGLATERPDILTYEHSIAGLVPAIARLMPDARIVPLAVRRMPESGIRRVAEAVAELSGEETLVVASVDFSHYRSGPEARSRNAESIRTLRTQDVAGLLRYGNEHMDSPASIAILVAAMRTAGANRFVLGADTDSSAITGIAAPPVTSYIVGYYAPRATG